MSHYLSYQQKSGNHVLEDTLCTDPTQRLPDGVDTITLMRNDQGPITIKLSKTQTNQYWCTVKVEEITGKALRCPGSQTALVTKLLKRLPGLAEEEELPVKVPILTKHTRNGESFEAIAVPGLKTHVFVGPFESNEGILAELEHEEANFDTRYNSDPDENSDGNHDDDPVDSEATTEKASSPSTSSSETDPTWYAETIFPKGGKREKIIGITGLGD